MTSSYQSKYQNINFVNNFPQVTDGDSYQKKYPLVNFDDNSTPTISVNVDYPPNSYRQKEGPILSTNMVTSNSYPGVTVPNITVRTGTTVNDVNKLNAVIPGGNYVMIVPSDFNGTVYLFSHGTRYPIPLPFLGAPTVSYVAQSEMMQFNDSANPLSPEDFTVINYLLGKGFAVMGSGFSKQGYNIELAHKANVELILLFKKTFTTKNVIVWGFSIGGFATQSFDEKYPQLINATGLISPLSVNMDGVMSYAKHALWLFKQFFDPDNDVKAINYNVVTDSLNEVNLDVYTLFGVTGGVGPTGGLFGNLGVCLVGGGTDWTQTTQGKPSWLGSSTMTPLGAVTFIGLICGIPLRSKSFSDGTNPIFAIFENLSGAIGLALSFSYDLQQICVGNVLDNTLTKYKNVFTVANYPTKATYSAYMPDIENVLTLLDNYGLTRFVGNDTAISYAETNLTQETGKVNNVPTIVLQAIYDGSIVGWNIQEYIDLYNINSSGTLGVVWCGVSNDSSGGTVGPVGIGHGNFKRAQMIAFADALYSACSDGKYLSDTTKNLMKLMKNSDATDFTSFENPDFRFDPVPLINFRFSNKD